MSTDDFEGVVVWGGHAANLAKRLGNHEILASARVSLSAAEYTVGRHGGRESLELELETALSTGLEEVAARALNALVRVAGGRASTPSSIATWTPASSTARIASSETSGRALVPSEPDVLLDRGEWTLATDAASLVLSTARTAGMAPFVALTVLGQVRARRGDPGWGASRSSARDGRAERRAHAWRW